MSSTTTTPDRAPGASSTRTADPSNPSHLRAIIPPELVKLEDIAAFAAENTMGLKPRMFELIKNGWSVMACSGISEEDKKKIDESPTARRDRGIFVSLNWAEYEMLRHVVCTYEPMTATKDGVLAEFVRLSSIAHAEFLCRVGEVLFPVLSKNSIATEGRAASGQNGRRSRFAAICRRQKAQVVS